MANAYYNHYHDSMLNFGIAANFNFERELKVVSCAVCSSLTTEATSRSSDFQWERCTNYELKQKNQQIHKDTNHHEWTSRDERWLRFSRNSDIAIFRKEYKWLYLKAWKLKYEFLKWSNTKRSPEMSMQNWKGIKQNSKHTNIDIKIFNGQDKQQIRYEWWKN